MDSVNTTPENESKISDAITLTFEDFYKFDCEMQTDEGDTTVLTVGEAWEVLKGYGKPIVSAPELPTTATASDSNQTKEKSFEELFVPGSRWFAEGPKKSATVARNCGRYWFVYDEGGESVAEPLGRWKLYQHMFRHIGPPEQVEPSRLEKVRRSAEVVKRYDYSIGDALTLLVEELETRDSK